MEGQNPQDLKRSLCPKLCQLIHTGSSGWRAGACQGSHCALPTPCPPGTTQGEALRGLEERSGGRRVLENKVLEPQCSGIAHAACVTGSREERKQSLRSQEGGGVVVPQQWTVRAFWLGDGLDMGLSNQGPADPTA